MRIVPLGAFLAVAYFATGCGDLLSLHALHTKQGQVFDSSIEGSWENDDDLLAVNRDDDLYQLTLQSKRNPEDTSKFEMHLVDLNGVRFADLLPADMVGHMILRVRASEGQLRVDFFDSAWLRQTVAHEDADIENGRKQAILILRTPQLRGLVAKYSREPRAFADETTFRRVAK